MTTHDPSTLSQEYKTHGYVVMRGFVDPEVAACWEANHRPMSESKVHVGRAYKTVWTEQMFGDAAQALGGLAVANWFLSFVCSVTGISDIDKTKTHAWINRYGPGDQVPEHCDKAGDTQSLLCLQGPHDPENGGELMIDRRVVSLQAGDAVLFFARGVPHAVSMIGSNKVGASGYSRVTCVIRLFATDNDEGLPLWKTSHPSSKRLPSAI